MSMPPVSSSASESLVSFVSTLASPEAPFKNITEAQNTFVEISDDVKDDGLVGETEFLKFAQEQLGLSEEKGKDLFAKYSGGDGYMDMGEFRNFAESEGLVEDQEGKLTPNSVEDKAIDTLDFSLKAPPEDEDEV